MALIKRVERYGFKSIMLAVDSAVAGKRELDLRAKGDVAAAVKQIAFFFLWPCPHDFQAPLDTERPRPGSMGVAHVSPSDDLSIPTVTYKPSGHIRVARSRRHMQANCFPTS